MGQTVSEAKVAKTREAAKLLAKLQTSFTAVDLHTFMTGRPPFKQYGVGNPVAYLTGIIRRLVVEGTLMREKNPTRQGSLYSLAPPPVRAVMRAKAADDQPPFITPPTKQALMQGKARPARLRQVGAP